VAAAGCATSPAAPADECRGRPAIYPTAQEWAALGTPTRQAIVITNETLERECGAKPTHP